MFTSKAIQFMSYWNMYYYYLLFCSFSGRHFSCCWYLCGSAVGANDVSNLSFLFHSILQRPFMTPFWECVNFNLIKFDGFVLRVLEGLHLNKVWIPLECPKNFNMWLNYFVFSVEDMRSTCVDNFTENSDALWGMEVVSVENHSAPTLELNLCYWIWEC